MNDTQRAEWAAIREEERENRDERTRRWNYIPNEKRLAAFWDRTAQGENGCVVWLGPKDADGYGMVRMSGNVVRRAPRIAYALAKGAIPDGMIVMHACDNPPCVNPEHLTIGTHADNMADKVAKGRARGYPKGTHCINGHEFTSDSSYFNGKQRLCRLCRRERARARRERRRLAA